MLEIISAKYGTESQFIDITEKLKNMINDNLLYISKYTNINLLFGDPIHGKEKKIKIIYKCDDLKREFVVSENRNIIDFSINICYINSTIINSLGHTIKDRYETELLIYYILKSKNVLIFGLKSDSDIWSRFHSNIYYVENEEKSIKRYGNNKNIIKTNYQTINSKYLEYMDNSSILFINNIPKIEWDLIIIDGPSGFSGKSPGRMSSIYTSSIISNKKTKILLNDIYRDTESIYSEKYLRKKFMFRRNYGKLFGFFFNKDT